MFRSYAALGSRPAFLVERTLVFRHDTLQVEQGTLRDGRDVFRGFFARRHDRPSLGGDLTRGWS